MSRRFGIIFRKFTLRRTPQFKIFISPTRCLSTSQPPSSAVGPNAFYESDSFNEDLRLKASSAAKESEARWKALQQESRASPKELQNAIVRISDIQSPLRTYLKSVSRTMNESVYFYNERNPHLGMSLNIKETMYNYYNMVGPLKTAWYDVLSKDPTLTELIVFHLQEHNGPLQDCASGVIPVSHIVSLIESVERKTCVSCLKYTRMVKEGNCIQFKCSKLSHQEVVVLQILAQYAFYDYELV